MASQDKGRPLPKFGEWDVNNPASAEGFTVIFNQARDDKKTNASNATPRKTDSSVRRGGTKYNNDYRVDNYPQYPQKVKKKWFCCG
uniref:RPM1-interacting protein 4-like isoform X1 n=1 Tax=Fragaria vesca subsp. vesca TaxID=101020 RepID=UPI0005CB5C70|nr:PREDICTED: RPM1-interacting protein 4-like isoform X1 [Fragaria vesca subsp. vesca]